MCLCRHAYAFLLHSMHGCPACLIKALRPKQASSRLFIHSGRCLSQTQFPLLLAPVLLCRYQLLCRWIHQCNTECHRNSEPLSCFCRYAERSLQPTPRLDDVPPVITSSLRQMSVAKSGRISPFDGSNLSATTSISKATAQPSAPSASSNRSGSGSGSGSGSSFTGSSSSYTATSSGSRSSYTSASGSSSGSYATASASGV